MTHSEFLELPPLMSAHGTVRLPGSKSISNRVLLLAALAEGVTEVRDLLKSDDTDRMLDALRTLGVKVEPLGDNAYRITGCGGNFPVKETKLFLGNAGTAFRPLTAVLAFSGGKYLLHGVDRMHERPIGDLREALHQLGANIEYLVNNGFPPLQIHPASLSGVARVSVRGDVSSQFLTALLMALPLLDRAVTVEVVGELISKPYIEITLAMMARFGIIVARDGWRSFTVKAGSCYVSPQEIYVEGDASSASYFLAAGAIGGGSVRVEGVGSDSVQGDVRFADALKKMGAQITKGPNWMEARAPASGKLKGIDLDCNQIPDAAMTLAVVALFADGVTTLRNIASWRVKETDRIKAMAAELRKLGANVVAPDDSDFIRIAPLAHFKHVAIDTYDDHRIAMCFSLAAFGGAGVRIMDPKCVAKTFPDYFEKFMAVVQSASPTPTLPRGERELAPVIAIDGPSASGKGTVAQRVATALGMHYLDSGALYRLLGLAAQKRGIALDEETKLSELAGQVDILFEGEDIWLDGAKVGDELRTEEAGSAASKIAALPKVRAALLDKQRAFRRAPGLVADGRDMASVVFPDSILKIFLTASAAARAERRYKQLKQKGMSANIAALLQDIQARDERDTQRSVAPLQQAQGASLLDTTPLNIEQAVQEVLSRYRALESK
jgi:3-phosphoshikimate 1-carboxyvinyltransferase